jgi:hypothetical protein
MSFTATASANRAGFQAIKNWAATVGFSGTLLATGFGAGR